MPNEDTATPIEIKRIKRQLEDGTYEVTMALTEPQTYFLMTMAINILIAQGVANYKDVIAEDNPTAYLEGLNPKDLAQS